MHSSLLNRTWQFITTWSSVLVVPAVLLCRAWPFGAKLQKADSAMEDCQLNFWQ